MSTSIGGVHVDLGLNSAQFNQGINNARKTAKGFGTDMKSIMSTAVKSFGTGLLTGLVGAGGVGGTVAALRQVAGAVADIRNEAARAGVTTQVFQEWQAVAVKARIPMDAMADAFKELAIRADEFAVTGKGSAAEAFARLGLTPEEVQQRLKNPAELMLLLIDRTRQLGDTAAATRVFDELFGGTGAERLVSLLGQSTDEIRATIDEAHRLGNVLDDDVIARAAEIDRQFNVITHTVGQNLKGAIVSAATALAQFIDSFRSFENQQAQTLSDEITTIGRQRMDLENKILKLRSEQRDAIAGNPFGRDYEADIQYLQDEYNALGETEAQILRVIAARRKAAETPPPAPEWTPTPYTPPPAGGSGGRGGGRDKSAAHAEREAEAVRRLIGDLQTELQLVGATNLERDIANTLRQAGASATADQQAQIVALISAIHAEEEATRRATDAALELRDIGRDVLGGMISDLKAGKDAADILANALDRVADRLINMALDGLFSGGGAGKGGGDFLGSTFSLNLRRTA